MPYISHTQTREHFWVCVSDSNKKSARACLQTRTCRQSRLNHRFLSSDHPVLPPPPSSPMHIHTEKRIRQTWPSPLFPYTQTHTHTETNMLKGSVLPVDNPPRTAVYRSCSNELQPAPRPPPSPPPGHDMAQLGCPENFRRSFLMLNQGRCR